ncbi:MAG: type IV pilin-like G/H family protein [Stenomitos frigidus ULC029]
MLHLKAKQNIGFMNRAQERYFLEKGKFSGSLNQLGLGFQPQSAQFVYSVRATADAAFQYGTTRSDCRLCKASFYNWLPPAQGKCFSDFCAKPIHCKSQSYAGVTYVKQVANKIATQSVLCEAKEPRTVQLNPIYRNGIVDCGANAKKL